MFLEKMNEVLNEDYNYSVTENGGLGYATTGKKLVDLNFATSSLRHCSNEEIIEKFMLAYYENPQLALKWLFYLRDIRGGLGERRSFKVILKYLVNEQTEAICKFIEYIPEYGRWDDLLVLLDTKLKDEVLDIIRCQLSKDIVDMANKRTVSLLGKWLPRENASNKDTIKNARLIRKELKISAKEYREILSELNRYLKTIEVDMCDKNWSEIDYNTVPSNANLKYNSAFLRNDNARRIEYLENLKNGNAKINSSVLFPHDIVNKYIHKYYVEDYDETLEQLWKNLPNLVEKDNNTIVVADGSGSMTVGIDNKSETTALDVANSLAIYFAEHSNGEFANKYVTFSNKPQLVDFSNCKSLKDKLDLALKYDEISDTNIEATFDLILKTAINNDMSQEDMPNNILVISDMEFNASRSNYNKRVFDNIKAKFEMNGYKVPKLIFWNVNSRTNTIPLRENDLGVILVSGFSVNVLNMVFSNELDPYKALYNILMNDRYSIIE